MVGFVGKFDEHSGADEMVSGAVNLSLAPAQLIFGE